MCEHFSFEANIAVKKNEAAEIGISWNMAFSIENVFELRSWVIHENGLKAASIENPAATELCSIINTCLFIFTHSEAPRSDSTPRPGGPDKTRKKSRQHHRTEMIR
jgi:hypothetical protein